MALRVNDGGSNFLQYTSGAPDNNDDYTIFAWIYLRTDVNDFSGFYATDTFPLTNYDYLGTAGDGTSLRVASFNDPTTSADNDGTFPFNVWTPTALRRIGSTLEAWIDGSVLSSFSAPVAGRATATRIEIGHVVGAATALIDIAFMRVWEQALTDEQLILEACSATPVVTSNLWADYPFPNSGALLQDASGNGRHWSDFGAAPFVANPTLPSCPSGDSIVPLIMHLKRMRA